MANLKTTINESFIQYSGAVLQSRALVDVRDGLKPSARQIFYSMLTRKLTHDKPYKKTANAVGMAMADFYIHGDSSCEGVIMRAGQPFAMRYPLVEVKGNVGSLIESGNWAAMRYTESRLSKLSLILLGILIKIQFQTGATTTTIRSNIQVSFQAKASIIFAMEQWVSALEWPHQYHSIICVR